jgi:integrase/recombinase XerD
MERRRSQLRMGRRLKIMQTQVGHSYASTTGLYTSVSADFKQKAVQQMIAQRIAQKEGTPDA